MNQKITLLDLGGVVFQSTGISNEKIRWEVITLLNEKYGHALNIGANKFPDFLSEYNQLTKQKLSEQVFLEEIFNTLEINQELIDLMSAQSDIVIVSDNYRENITYISERYHFKDWAIKEIYSYDYQMEKANPDFFKKLLGELKGYEVEDLLFIDDSIKKIESAALSGIRGILYKNNQQLKRDLKALGREHH